MVRQWSWLRLLSYCLSRVVAISLVIAVVLVGGALAFAHGQTVKVPRRNNIRQSGVTYQPISGVITDSDCGARHGKDATALAAIDENSGMRSDKPILEKKARFYRVFFENRFKHRNKS